MKNWHQYAFGYLHDGSRVMLVTVEGGFCNRKRFPAVLVCRPDGLHRLWRGGHSRLLASGYIWPEGRDAEKSLRPHAPKAWGSQRDSACVLKRMPDWLLRGNSVDLARLLIAWFVTNQSVFSSRVSRVDRFICKDTLLPESPLTRPVALTIIPNTDVVVKAIHSGILLKRLKLGLERIYISEFCWIRAPKLQVILRALQARFPERLVLVRAQHYEVYAQALKMTRVRVKEHQFIGGQLQGRYEDDFDYDRLWNTAPLEGMFLYRIGDIPRGLMLFWIRQTPLALELWDDLDVHGMFDLKKQSQQRRNTEREKAVAFLTNTLKT